MPTLNYENAGALVEYDYLQGTITALYPDDDTADIDGDCGELTGIPIFYHCDPDATARDNGSIEGAVFGFKIDDKVIVLSGRDGTDSLGHSNYVVGRYDGVRVCEAVYFLTLGDGLIDRTMTWYKVDGTEIESIEITTEDVRWFEDSWPVGIGKLRFDAAYQSFNAAMIRVCAIDGDDDIISWFDFPLRIPVTVIGTEKIAWLKNAIGRWSPDQSWVDLDFKLPCYDKGRHTSKFGVQLECAYFPDFYLSAYSSPSLFTGYYPLHGGDVFEIRHYSDGYYTTPTDGYAENIFCMCPSTYKDKTLMAIASFDSAYWVPEIPPYPGYWKRLGRKFEGSFLEAFIAVWPSTFFQEGYSYIWRESYSGKTGGALSTCEKLITLTKAQFYQLSQIECVDDKIYIFSDSGKGFRPAVGSDPDATPSWEDISQLARVDVFDFSGTKLMEKVFSDYYIDRVSLVDYTKPTFCFRLMSTESDGGYSPMLMIDAETLETVKSVDLPQKQAVAMNKPIMNYLLKKVNELRATQPWVPEVDGTLQEVAYLGYNLDLEALALSHLEWCIANNVLSHEDENGDKVEVRASKIGCRHALENLAFIPASADEVDVVMDGWINSPLHFAALVNIDAISMGYATAVVPVECEEITVNGTAVAIPENMRGKYKVYCQVFSIG